MGAPKFFAMDIDGTFITYDRKLSPENKRSFEKVIKSGINAFFCTGRSRMSALEITGYSNSDVYKGFPGVFLTGAIVYDDQGQIISNKYFDKDVFLKIADFFNDIGIAHMCAYYSKDIIYFIQGGRAKYDGLSDAGIFTDVESYKDIADSKINQIVILEMPKHPEALTKFDGILYKIYFSFNGMAEILPLGVTKKGGIETLLNHYNGNFDELVAIGDGENDVEMLASTKYSYAVSNGCEKAINAANYTTIANTDSAVAKVLGDVLGI